MMAFDRNLISEAVRLFEGHAISPAEADELHAKYQSREDFLGALWFHRGLLARSPDLSAAIARTQLIDPSAGDRTRQSATPLDRNLIGEAVRLFEGRAISAAEADELLAKSASREDFLGELWFRRGSLAGSPDLAAAVERARDMDPFANDSAERAFYEDLFARFDPSQPTALYVPRWRGVANATRCLFRQAVPIPTEANDDPDYIPASKIAAYADILLASGIRHFVISGGDDFHLALIATVKRLDSGIRFDLTWHYNYAQMGDIHDWRLFWRWLRAFEDGLITRFGVTKSGLDGFLQSWGIDAVCLPQFFPIDPERLRPGKTADVAGIWLSGSSSYRKLPHAMIAAVKAMRSFYLKGAGLGAEGLALVSALDVPLLQVVADPIPYDQLLREIASTAVSLYVTVSECSPMLPLESFALGVPCLIGPSSHLFRDHALLREMLVVEQPYNPGLIADMALAAAAQRDDLVAAYSRYNQEVEVQARDALARFLA